MTDRALPDGAERVAWTVRADDPWTAIHRPDDGDPDTAQALAAQVAAEHGAVLEYVIDTDDIDGLNYYEWELVVPREQHDARPAGGSPVAVAAVLAALRTALPDESLRWAAYPDDDLTGLLHDSTTIRRAYRPLVEAMESVLLPLRVDGAEVHSPHITVTRLAGGRIRGDYSVYLCQQPPDGLWCLMRAGVADDLPFAPTHERQHGSTRGSLVLPMPPPPAPVVYGAEIATGPFPGLASRWESGPSVVGWGPKLPRPGVGARHQWLSNDPVALAQKIRRTVDLWWPDGATPPARA